MTGETQTTGGRYDQLHRLSWYDGESLSSKTVIVAGAGAIGNWVLPHLALNGVGRIVIVDMDTNIEASNLPRSPLYTHDDFGEVKAETAAAKLRSLNPDIEIEAITGDVQFDLGLGRVRSADLVVGCLDSRMARMVLNGWSVLCRTPYFDSGADGQTLTGRVQTFAPGPDASCLLCGWYDEDFRNLEQRLSCDRDGKARPNGAPTFSTIAALTGAVLSNEAVKLLLGIDEFLSPGTELRYDLWRNTQLRTRLPRSAACLVDHDRYISHVRMLPAGVREMTLRELFRIVRPATGGNARLNFHRDIVTHLACACGKRREILKIEGKLTARDLTCDRCSALMEPHRRENHLSPETCPAPGMTVADLGIPARDIVEVTGAGESRFFEFPKEVSS